jgi:predicted permease
MILAVTGETYGWIALAIGLAAALVVAGLLAALLMQTARIRRSTEGLLETAAEVGANTAHIPQLEATAPVLAEIFDEAVVQDGYMNALTDGFGPLADGADEAGEKQEEVEA